MTQLLDLKTKAPAAAGRTLGDGDAFAVLRKTWQPVVNAVDLPAGRILSYTLLGEEIVVSRLPGGLLAARDVCPHRGAKFGLGSVVNGHLQCPYHGWEFAASGACARIPSLVDASCPAVASASLTTFAVQERYGIIWVRLDAEEIAPLPEVPEFEDAAWTYVVPDPMVFGGGFRREVENYLDMSHFAFAHKDTLGVAASGEITHITITHFPDGFQMDAPFPVLASPDRTPGKLQQSHHRRQRCFLPNFTTIRQSFHDGDSRVLLHVPSPNTPTQCTVFWALAISPGFDGPPPEQQVKFAIRVLDEDRVMVENQRPREVPLSREDVVLVPADRLANTYKSALRDFLVGVLDGPAAVVAEADVRTVTVLYGSQTGNAENLSHRLGRTLERAGLRAAVRSLGDVKPADLDGLVLVVTSTYGDGNPPDNAAAFFDALHADDAPDLSRVRFAVFGLGDRAYTHFCQCGRDLDARLEELGAARLLSRVDADRDFDAAFARWVADVQQVPGRGRPQEVVALVEDDGPVGYSAARPTMAHVTENRRLSRLDSDKETRHYELDLPAAGVTYEPGDLLGVIAANDPDVVSGLIDLLSARPDHMLPDGHTLRTTLLRHRELRRPSAALVAAAAELAGDDDLLALATAPDRAADRAAWLDGADVYDLLLRVPQAKAMSPERLAALCHPLLPRMYSIASSPLVFPDAAHLLVATVRYARERRSYRGVASTFLADRVRSGDTVPVFVRKNAHFRLPADETRDVIMIGPGTGVAPFRAFLQHRQAAAHRGRNWLFFGDRTRAGDYLYQTELEAWHASGHLTHLDTAFSRDTAEKVYVQHALEQRGDELFRWLQDGAHLYVCGDEKRMARDVDQTLRAVIARAGAMGKEQADDYVKRLQTAGRYARDVY